jgi:sarcosine oxidase subunit alpha
MVERAGWRTAAHFTGAEDEARRVRDGAGLGDVSQLGKLDVRGTQLDDLAPWPERAVAERGGPPSPGARGGPPGLPRRVWRLAHGHALVTCGPEERADLAARLAAAVSPAACLHLTDVTSVYAALLLAGPASRAILHRLTAIDVEPEALPDRSAVQGGVAHVHTILLRADLGAPAGVPGYWLLVAREYGEYLWDTVLHAGHRLGIVPFGASALDALEARP